MSNTKKLYRSKENKMLGGVCGGLAEYFDIDVTVVRLIYVLGSLFTACFPGVILYIICLFIMPQDPGYIDV